MQRSPKGEGVLVVVTCEWCGACAPPGHHRGYRIGVRYDGWGWVSWRLCGVAGASVSPPGPLGTGLRRHDGWWYGVGVRGYVEWDCNWGSVRLFPTMGTASGCGKTVGGFGGGWQVWW